MTIYNLQVEASMLLFPEEGEEDNVKTIGEEPFASDNTIWITNSLYVL